MAAVISRRRHIAATLALSAVSSITLVGSTDHGVRAAGIYTLDGQRIDLNQPSDPFIGTLQPETGAETRGMYGPQIDWPLIPIHAVLTPDGTLITHGTPIGAARQGGVVSDAWNLADGTESSSHTQYQTLPDGQIVALGGNSTTSTVVAEASGAGGLLGQPLDEQRWYASVIRRPDDRTLVLGGADHDSTSVDESPIDESTVGVTPEIGNGVDEWQLLTGARNTAAFGVADNRWSYPRAYNSPDGSVFGVSWDQMWRLDDGGAGSVHLLGRLPTPVGASGSSVMFAPGRILFAGGGQRAYDELAAATARAVVVDIGGAEPVVTETAPMQYARNWLDLTALPNGEVLASGGTGFEMSASSSAYEVEIWNPDTGLWRVGDSARRIRTYHSTAILLPTGAVFTGGGSVPGPEDNLNAELYYPSYLFESDADGTVAWADRPTIDSLSGHLTRGSTITAEVSGAPIASASLISVGNVTHGYNTDQRAIPLTVTGQSGTIDLTIPADPNLVPPGSYMLQVVDTDGVPSPSQILTIPRSGPGTVTIFDTGSDHGGRVEPGTAGGGFASLDVGSTVGFESVDYPGRRVRHLSFQAWVDPIDQWSGRLAREDSSFVVRAGLADRTARSFEAVNFPGYFLREENGTIMLRRNDGSTGFAAAATFVPVVGNSGRYTSLQMWSDPTRFVRHDGFRLRADPSDNTDLFRSDSTFIVRAALTEPDPTMTAVAPTTSAMALLPTTTMPPTATASTTTVPPTTTTTTTAPVSPASTNTATTTTATTTTVTSTVTSTVTTSIPAPTTTTSAPPTVSPPANTTTTTTSSAPPAVTAPPNTTTTTTTASAPPTVTAPHTTTTAPRTTTTTTTPPNTTTPPTTTTTPPTTTPPTVTTTTLPADPLVIGSTIGFESVNLPGRRIRHRDFQAWVDAINQWSSRLAREDSSFVVRAGLADGTARSFEAVNFPGYFLREENGTIMLRRNDGSTGFAAAATFVPVVGNTGRYTSLQTWSDPTRFVRHDGFRLRADPSDNTAAFRSDSTFIVRAALA